MTAPRPESAPVFRRGFAILVLGALLVVGLAIDQGLGSSTSDESFVAAEGGTPAAAQGPQIPTDETVSAAWYCPEGTASEDGRADEIVVVANAGEQPLDAVITVFRGDKRPRRQPVAVGPRSRVEVRVADIVEAPEPGVVVETFGPDAAVEHMLIGEDDIATGPCARHPSDRWWFAGGTTVKDARDVLAILNPFPDDAIVDMTFFTDDGIERPSGLQGLPIPGRSRRSVLVNDHVLRKSIAGAEIVARSGRVVVERSISWDGTTERQGLAVSLGATSTAPRWMFPEGLVQANVAEDLWILNPSERNTEVEIQPRLDGKEVTEPSSLEVPARSAVSFRVNDIVDNDVGHSLQVSAVGDEDVIVQQEITAVEGATRPGYAVVPGITQAARRWVFAAGSAEAPFDEWLTVTNPGVEKASFTIWVLAGGQLLEPEGMGSLTLGPTARGTFRLGDALKRSDAVMIESDRPLTAVRGLFTDDAISVSPGIPFPE